MSASAARTTRRRRTARRSSTAGVRSLSVWSGRAAAAGFAAAVAGGVLLAVGAVPADAQLRRAADVPAVADRAGRLLLGAGVGISTDGVFPHSGLRGDLARLGEITVAYAFAPGALLYAEGAAVRILDVESRGPSAVPLDADVDDGVVRDAGDVRVGTVARLLGGPRGGSGGLRLEVTLPTSDERKGIGTNTTDVAGTVFGSWADGPVRLTGETGVAILEAPTEAFVQNDVVVYAAEALWRPAEAAVAISLSARGRASTRGHVPLGTEDRGRVRLRGEIRLGRWRMDAGVSAGYAGTSPDRGIEVGAARVLDF